jgi:hypothetical protein
LQDFFGQVFGGVEGGALNLVSGADTASAIWLPQPPQNFSPGSLEKPQEGQARFKDAPHSAQNRLSFRFSA